jgi:hypothetical protein
MTDDEAVAVYGQAYNAAREAADNFAFILEKISGVASFLRGWKGRTFAPDALRRCLEAIVAEKRSRGWPVGLNAEWPTGDDIHNALGDWKAKRTAADRAWASIPEHRKPALKHPETLDF